MGVIIFFFYLWTYCLKKLYYLKWYPILDNVSQTGVGQDVRKRRLKNKYLLFKGKI